jgi:mono/diheme cytochrome c family protein
MRSNFLAFDLHFYKFPIAKPKLNQQGAFKSLNEDIVKGVGNGTGTGAAIVEVIDTSFYPGNSATQIEDKVVANWDPGNVNSNAHRFYRDVFARACRTCHTAQPFSALTFTDHNTFEASIVDVQNRVCNQKVMPHAQRTHDVFWTSLDPNMPALLELYGQTLPGWSSLGSAQCGQVFQSGGTAPSVFASEIYPTLFNNCTGCHSQPGNANYSIGNIGNTYNSLLNTTAKDGVSKYILPHDPTNSLLYHRITTGGTFPPNAPPNVRMPQNGKNLAIEDTDVPPDGIPDASQINAWINAGALGP